MARVRSVHVTTCQQTRHVVPLPIDRGDKLAAFEETVSPKVVARLDDHEIKLAKLERDF
jgi:hypothetical protein